MYGGGENQINTNLFVDKRAPYLKTVRRMAHAS